ncbi:MAG: DNA integrity scanning protein DisA nucleotide-binding domain protein, partial [Deltaproteobacteria bacterium]|nr:DNA integrity scanning protein DisA nucleotide-binding domain protein [Deltaproteobacteria bacterium]
EYVLQGFFAILIIALIIIFQEDLRRFFERLATWRIIRKIPLGASPHHEAEVICRAVEKMIQKRHGALIVLTGDDLLDRHLRGGFLLEGNLSETILESIFDPHSTGHDGAVIIENGMIGKFGCHLPLSLNIAELGNLGLRHTAALGLSERCDAICIAVSEENGTVAIARDGTLSTLLNPHDLISILEQFFNRRVPAGKKGAWLGWISENSWEKATAIILACGLWFAFGYQTESIRRDYVIPIVYKNLMADWIIEEQKSKEATTTLMGSKQAFDLLNVDSLKIVLDMTEVKEGKQQILIGTENLQHPSNVTVVDIKPGKIGFVARRFVRIDAPIEVRTSGALPEGLKLKNIDITPASIQVITLSKKIKNLKIVTEPINLEEISETTTLTPQLIIPEEVQSVNGRQPSIEVTIEIE